MKFILDILPQKHHQEFIYIILSTKSKKLVKEQEIPSGHNPDRLYC